mmetsp:Transcript_21455/g.21579  ORF Transcript_21455/g.21579 Transcript_21455/m.21579 type:complete len:174 (-) Transcript_21455:250-771(-)
MQVPYEKKFAGSDIGLGLFSTSNIPAGTLVWKFQAGHNVLMYNEQDAYRHLSKKTIADAQTWLDMTYGLFGHLCEICDDGKFMNHASTPNCKTNSHGDTYAIVDIMPGEQLFEDYSTFEHPPFLLGLLNRFDCAPDYYEIVPDIKPTFLVEQNVVKMLVAEIKLRTDKIVVSS